MTKRPIIKDLTVNELLALRPEASAVLLDLGIDTCCGGSLPLEVAARDAGQDVEAVVLAVGEKAVPAPAPADCACSG